MNEAQYSLFLLCFPRMGIGPCPQLTPAESFLQMSCHWEKIHPAGVVKPLFWNWVQKPPCCLSLVPVSPFPAPYPRTLRHILRIPRPLPKQFINPTSSAISKGTETP